MAARSVNLRREERRILAQRAAYRSGDPIRRQPSRQEATGREPADDNRVLDSERNKADEIIAHVIQSVSAGCAGGPSLPPEIYGEALEMFLQNFHRFLVAPP